MPENVLVVSDKALIISEKDNFSIFVAIAHSAPKRLLWARSKYLWEIRAPMPARMIIQSLIFTKLQVFNFTSKDASV